jgi:hypothetical protein
MVPVNMSTAASGTRSRCVSLETATGAADHVASSRAPKMGFV